MSQRPDTYILRGGLDIETPSAFVEKGMLIGGENYEPVTNGYRRMDGYERSDGRLAPSQARFWVADFVSGLSPLSVGKVVVGQSSQARGIVLVDAVPVSGTWANGTATGRVVLWNVVGTFQVNEQLRVAGVPHATLQSLPLLGGADNDEEAEAWTAAARAAARNAIRKPPGVGPVRGVWSFKGDGYAIRDQVGGNAALFRSSSSGWVQQDLGHHIRFGSGVREPDEGRTLTGQTSGATATLRRVATREGAWGQSQAEGIFAISNIIGSFQVGEMLTVDGAVVAQAMTGSVANLLPSGGRYDFNNHNFFGSANMRRMYGCGGVGPAWEWDGQVFVPIFTGMADDRPIRVRAHKNHLFLAFPGGSLQHSSTGNPYGWSAVTGAAELGIGDEITGLSSDLASTLLVLAVSRIGVLYGSSIDDWQFDTYTNESGSKPWTVQRIGDRPLFVDDGGVRDFRQSDRFGDFQLATITESVRKLIAGKVRANVEPVASLRSKRKAQYRLFWSDGTGLSIYLGRKQPEIIPFRLPVRVTCTCAAEDEFGNEVLLAGTEDGWVVRMDSGSSFDGAPIRAFVRLPFNHLGRPNQNKRFHKVLIDIENTGPSQLAILADYSFGSEDGSPSASGSLRVSGGGGFWEEAQWDGFAWSAAYQGQAQADIDGFGINSSILILSESVEEDPHTLQSAHLFTSMRGLQR